MKLLAKMRNNLRKSLSNERGQGATEYILLLVVVVGLVMIFKDKIRNAMNTKLADLDNGMSQVTVDK
jgi:Flp pilus assembly pilin Flp